MENRGFLGKLRKNITPIKPEVEAEAEDQKPQLVIPSGTSKFEPTYEPSAYLDKKGLEEEKNIFMERIVAVKNSLPKGIGFQRKDDMQRYTNLNRKLKESWEFIERKDDKVFSRETEEIAPEVSFQGLYLHFLLRAGTELVMEDNLKRQGNLLRRNQVDDKNQTYLDMLKFYYAEGIATRINGISISDLIHEDTASKFSQADIYKFFLKCFEIKRKLTHGEFVEDNSRHFGNLYPNLAKSLIEVSTGYVQAAVNIDTLTDDNLLESLIISSKGIARDIGQRAKQFKDKMVRLYKNSYKILLNPESPEFESMKQIVDESLKKGIEDRIISLYVLGITNNKNNIAELYRKSRNFRLQGKEAEFYDLLGSSLLEYVEALSTPDILIKDDLILVTNADDKSNLSNVPTFEDFTKRAQSIVQKTSLNNKYEIKPTDIEWKGIVPPQSASIVFSKEQPGKFTVSLHYQNKDGETLDIALDIDSKKHLLDWTFIESPDDPDMSEARNIFFSAAGEILNFVKRQTEIDYQEKLKAKAIIESQPEPNIPKKNHQGVWAPRKKEEKLNFPKLLTPVQDVLQNGILSYFEQGVKRYVSTSKGIEVRDYMKELSPKDQEDIIRTIEEFNKGQVGKFKKTHVKHNGEDVWELKSGIFRVLMTKASNENKITNGNVVPFDIYKIGYRRDTFKQ